MGYFPFFVDLEGREGLVVGGGAVALRKLQKLLPYGPRLTVAAPELLATPYARALWRALPEHGFEAPPEEAVASAAGSGRGLGTTDGERGDAKGPAAAEAASLARTRKGEAEGHEERPC